MTARMSDLRSFMVMYTGYWLLVFTEYLILHLQRNVIKTTWGVLDPPVGNTRLNVVRLVASLLQSNTHSINSELINLNTLGVILVSPLSPQPL